MPARLVHLAFTLGFVLNLGITGVLGRAQEALPSSEPKGKAIEPHAMEWPSLPTETRAKQSITLGARTLSYTVTVGALPILDERGKKIAEVVCTSYVLEGSHAQNRPVTFALNGGPGSSSVWLNLGAIGPKRVQFGTQGDNPSDPILLKDNPGTWLDFTDLVFIDPVGTGYSRALVSEEDAKKRFFTVKADIAYLSRIICDWLHLRDRMASPKYLVGESYGGFRVPRMAATLELELGVGLSGLIMVSPFLDGPSWQEGNFSPLPWMSMLPTLTAAHLERQGKLTAEAMVPVEAYARSEFAVDLLKGWSDREAVERIVRRVSDFTGLDPAFVRRHGGRINDLSYVTERFRNQGLIVSGNDAERTMPNPFPWSPNPSPENVLDPIFRDIVIATSTMVDFLGRTLAWKPKARYYSINSELPKKWENGSETYFSTIESGSDLKKVLALDLKVKVLITHGYTDLNCCYFNSKLLLSQIPPMGDPKRLQLKVYAGGHMFYTRPESLMAFRADAKAIYTDN